MWFFACALPEETGASKDSATEESGSVDTAPDSGGETAPPVDCAALPAPPEDATVVRGIDSSEDFAFSDDGWLVHVNDRYDLLRESKDGESELLVPDVGMIAGVAFLPDGSLAASNVLTGSVDRLTLDGGVEVLMSGLGYPNGLTVGEDGRIYVSDQTAGRVHAIDPTTGENEVVGSGMNNPNGVSIGSDGTVYVGSFGGGVVYAVARDGEGWARPALYAGRPGAFAVNTDMCGALAAGDACFRVGALGPGTCQPAGDTLVCTAQPDTAACAAAEPGAPCSTTLLGDTFDSTCTIGEDGVGFCPALDADRISACAGLAVYEACTYEKDTGYCNLSFEGVLACESYTEMSEAYLADCAERALGDTCAVADPLHPDQGVCTDGSAWGYADTALCLPPSYLAFGDGGGGFDALGVDECGDVYVGEYTTGRLYRWTEGGEAPETLLELDSAWIPNLHWGRDVGGWDARSLYVMNRDRGGGMFEVALGIGD